MAVPKKRISKSKKRIRKNIWKKKRLTLKLKNLFRKKKDTGSIEFQVLNFTNKIRKLTSHLEFHRKDFLSQRGLHKMLGKRQGLLSYLSKKSRIRYKELINQLDIRESQILY